MPNGDCPVGAENKTEIGALHREQKQQNKEIEKVCAKVDKLLYLVIATLAGVVVNLFVSLVGRMT